jgi:hypothetical protein
MQNTTQNTQAPQNVAIANENHSHDYAPVGGFIPALNKAGKVTSTAEKQALLLNGLDKTGIMAVAMNGKGKMAKSAAQAVGAYSLETLLASPVKLDGGQVASLRVFLVGAYGESYFNRETMRGLAGMVDYLNIVARKLELDIALAETATKQARIVSRLATVRAETASVQRLIELRDADIALSAKPAAPAAPAAPAPASPKAKAKA